ncbi:MAG: ABC transporter permease [Gemmatimonadota bacterium]
MDTLFQDLRYALRTLLRSRGFTTVAVLCLALGIGVNTAVFSMVNGVLFRDLPFEDPDRIVSVWSTNQRRGIEDGDLSYADLQDLRATGTFEQLGGITGRSVTITSGDQAVRVEGSSITPNLFALLGVQPQMGRNFREEEAAPAGFEQVVLLSDALWKEHFGADPAIVGKPIHMNGRELVVVGVMPPNFKFPETDQLWLPLGTASADNREARSIWPIGKLAAQTPLQAAQTQLRAVAQRWRTDFPQSHRDYDLRLLHFRDSIVNAPEQKLMYIMLGAVAFVLLIACANVANLFLARASDRAREIALRAAIGAGRGRILRQLLTESVLLAIAGGVLGLLISVWWVDFMKNSIPEQLAYWIDFGVDGAVLLYTVAISVGTGLLFGLMPALQATRVDLQTSLREGTRSATQSRVQNRFRSGLVVGEIALSLMLLVAATLMVQSFLRLNAASPGFATDRLLSLRITLAGDRYDPLEAKANFFQHAAERLSALPDVAQAAATIAIPADDGGASVPVLAEGGGRFSADAIMANRIVSTTNFFDALGLRLVAGRDFTPQEVRDSAARVAIVGTQLARRLWPDQDPIGRRLRIGEQHWFTVIGIAPDLQYEEFGEEVDHTRLQLHLPYAQSGTRLMAFMVRARGNPAELQRAVRAELRAIDPALAAFDVMTMAERRRHTTWPQRFFGQTFGTFGAAALVLALAGVYGVMAFSVARRRREIGIRIALGAKPRDVLRLVVGGAALLAASGVAIGIVGAWMLTRLLSGMLWGVTTNDPATFVITPLILAVAALTASYIPARRAARVDPMVALRSE